MTDDTALMRLVIEEIAKRHGVSYEQAFEKFYTSDTCKALSNKATGFFTYSHREIVDMLDEKYVYPYP